jgi:hypothetical protein
MPFEVLMTEDAARDLEEIYDYIARHDTQNRADHVLEKSKRHSLVCLTLPCEGYILRNWLHWEFANTEKSFLNPIVSFTGSWKPVFTFY